MQRPSLRELRIMLLHLLSRKRNIEDDAFEQKWKQLLPRQPVADVKANEPIATVSSTTGLQTPLTNQPQVHGFESNFVELNASMLAQQQTGNTTGLSLEEELADANQGKLVTGLANEMSLEAELSAAMQSSQDPLSLDKELSTANQSAGLSLQDELSMAETPKGSGSPKVNGTTSIVVTDASDKSIPDIVATSTIKTPSVTSPDFVTSTPRSSEADQTGASKSTTFVTASESGLTPTNSPLFQTAITSHNNSMGGEDDDGSLLGQRKFAAILQTVAAPSFDGDEYDVLSSSFGSSLDRSIDEVFNEFNNSTASNSGTYHKIPTTEDEKTALAAGEVIVNPGKPEQMDSLLVSLNGDAPVAATGQESNQV